MNERIRQLAEQAGLQLGTVLENYTTPVKTITVEQRKFAELIVQECLKICQNHPSIIFKNEWDADVVAPDIVNRLESHFGVEE